MILMKKKFKRYVEITFHSGNIKKKSSLVYRGNLRGKMYLKKFMNLTLFSVDFKTTLQRRYPCVHTHQ